MKISVTTPPQLATAKLSRSEWQRCVGVTRHAADRLIDTQWATLSIEDAAALAGRGLVSSDEPMPVLRLGGPGHDEDGRVTGIAPGYTDEQLEESARKWWRCNPDEITDAGFMVLAVGGFCVAIIMITALEASRTFTTPAGGTVTRYAFTARLAARVDNLVQGQTRVLVRNKLAKVLLPALGNRVSNPPGPPLVIIAPQT